MAVIDQTMGAAFIGVVIAGVLYGVSCVQLWFYYCRYTKDKWNVKLLVAAVWISDTVHQALISHTVYTYVITNFNNKAILEELVWSLIAEVLFNGITALLAQSFFTLRIWRLSERNIWLTLPVLLLVLGEFACVLAYVAQAFQLHTFIQLANLKALSCVVNGLAAAGDVLIALILCTMLHRSRTGFKRSDTLITKLIIFTVNTGLLTSICAVLSLITIVVLPNTFIYICFYFVLGRLYTNSLLATLNARKALRSKSEIGMSNSLQEIQLSPSLGSAPMSSSNIFTSKPSSQSISPLPGRIAIQIDTTMETDNDSDLSKLDTPSTKVEV